MLGSPVIVASMTPAKAFKASTEPYSCHRSEIFVSFLNAKRNAIQRAFFNLNRDFTERI